MKCRICGCEAPAGAKLCKDCAAARKRAFAATVTQPILLAAAGAPSVSQPRFSLRPAKPRKKPDPKPSPVRKEAAPAKAESALKARPAERGPVSPAISPVSPPTAPARPTTTAVRQTVPWWLSFRPTLRGLLIASGIAFAILLLAIMIVQRRSHPPSEEPAPAPAAAAVAPTPPALNTPPDQADTSVPAAAPASQVEAASPPVAKPAPQKARRKAPSADEATKAVPTPSPAVVAEPAPRNVVPPQPVVDTARTDPLRVLNETLARCAREDMINRPNCEQRARSQSCGNWWGQIPQCPIGPGMDHGQ
jgi:hypothetical protein